MKGTENLFKRFLSILGGKTFSTVVALVSTPIIVRLLGPGGYGDYAALLSIFSLYMIPVSSGVTEGVQKFVAEERDTPNWQTHVVRFYLLLATVAVVIAAVVLLAFTTAGYAEWLFGDAFTRYFYLLAGFVFVGQFRAVSYRTVLGFGKEPVSESLKVLKKLGTVVVGIALVTLGYGVSGMLLGHIVANVVVALGAGYVIARTVSARALLGRPPRGFPYRELLSFNGQNILLILLVMSLFHVDVVMLRTLGNSETTGFYKGALSIAEFLWFVPITLQRLLLHSSSSLWSNDRTERITELSARITRYTILLAVLMALGLAVLADEFLPLYYGPEFVAATTPLLLLLPGVIGFSAARPLQAISQGSGQIRTLVYATGTAATINLVANAVLIPTYGMIGAAVATSSGYGSMFLLLVWAARRIGYDPLDDFRPFRIAATALVTAPVIVLVETLAGSGLLALVVVPPVGGVVYLAAAILTGAVDASEVVEIGAKLPGPVGAFAESVQS